MAVTMADDELFTRAISGYRDAFLVQHSHLPESERNQLWGQRLSQFIPATASSSLNSYRPVSGSGILENGGSTTLEKSGKRARQDTPRTLPGSGLPPTKRRVTTPDPPVTVDLTRELSHASSPAAPQTAQHLSRSNSRKDGSSGFSGPGPSRHTTMVRSQSQQTPVSHRPSLASNMTGQRHSYGPSRAQRRLDHVSEYSPSEYAKQYLDDHQAQQRGASVLSMALSADSTSNGLDQQPSRQSPNQQYQGPSALTSGLMGMGHPSLADQAATGAVDMSRSTTTDSICGGISTMRFDSSGPNLDPNFSFPYPSSDFVSSTSPMNVPFSTFTSMQRDLDPVTFPFAESSAPPAFSCSAPSATTFPQKPISALPLSPAVEMKHSMSAESNSSSFSQPSRAARRTQEQIVQGARPIAPKVESNGSQPKAAEQHKMIRISSSDGTAKEVAAIPKASIQRPPRPKTYCSMCNDQPDGFHGEHELRRHIERVHAVIRKVWVCVDISPGKTFLANCKACRNGKRYGANYNAAAHLRRTHFNPCQRGRGGRGKDSEKRGGKGGGNHPPMEVLKHWMVQKEEIVLENAQNYIDQDAIGDDLAAAPSSVPTEDATFPGLSSAPADDMPQHGLESTMMTGYDAFSGFPTMGLDSSLDTSCYLDAQPLAPEIDSYV
ncbi:hypothetical protein N8T08_007393 [Aspergillus melleus]|uniref:Uncharacterized protein n=1 Tax=Aspergillus melleus TaxID=138277 RepID=A0ACC3AXQ2_9EURO|nr:hypothetical protein N8T08_007393 [Aspergillus melleus]